MMPQMQVNLMKRISSNFGKTESVPQRKLKASLFELCLNTQRHAQKRKINTIKKLGLPSIALELGIGLK
jgi:hypothetical protein